MRLKYETSRLRVFEVSSKESQPDLSRISSSVIALLTPTVVVNLPPYFQNINSVSDAEFWLDRMVSDSLLFVIKSRETDSTVGFLFAHVEKENEAHIGYLLGENYWGQGLATELLIGFIEKSIKEQEWSKLIGGVDKSNNASSHLLKKVGFIEQPSTDSYVVYYEYQLSQS